MPFQQMTDDQHDQIMRECVPCADRVMHYHAPDPATRVVTPQSSLCASRFGYGAWEDTDPERYEHTCPGSE